MGQMYVHRFEVRDGVSKSELDAAWGVAFKAFARSGNWGGVEKGVTHKQSYGTAWGAYVLIEVDNPEAFDQYQAFHLQNYAHVVRITYEPVYDMDGAFAETINTMR